jgi:hypothetical protein
MADVGRRLVAHHPPGGDEAPHQVDVLAEPQGRVEAADPLEGLPAHDQGGRRHVRDPATRPHRGRSRTEVQWRTGFLVGHEPGRSPAGGPSHDARGDGGDRRVGQVEEQSVEPSRLGLAPGVDKGDDVGGRLLPPDLAGPTGSP